MRVVPLILLLAVSAAVWAAPQGLDLEDDELAAIIEGTTVKVTTAAVQFSTFADERSQILGYDEAKALNGGDIDDQALWAWYHESIEKIGKTNQSRPTDDDDGKLPTTDSIDKEISAMFRKSAKTGRFGIAAEPAKSLMFGVKFGENLADISRADEPIIVAEPVTVVETVVATTVVATAAVDSDDDTDDESTNDTEPPVVAGKPLSLPLADKSHSPSEFDVAKIADSQSDHRSHYLRKSPPNHSYGVNGKLKTPPKYDAHNVVHEVPFKIRNHPEFAAKLYEFCKNLSHKANQHKKTKKHYAKKGKHHGKYKLKSRFSDSHSSSVQKSKHKKKHKYHKQYREIYH